MVNGPLPRRVAICLTVPAAAVFPANGAILAATKPLQTAASALFAQILGKLYFLQLRENLRRILFDYGQKHPRRANGAFNAAC
jgi:hypothetical protein